MATADVRALTLESKTDIEAAPCLADSPFADSARALIEASRELGQTQTASVLRAWCVAEIFYETERIFAGSDDPVPAFRALLETAAGALSGLASAGFTRFGSIDSVPKATAEAVESVTGKHYGNLFKGFSPASFWDETVKLLRTRLERNGIDPSTLAGKSVIDVGCGGGRYTAAWRNLGARPALGVDISPINIADARARVEAAGLDDIRYELADVLALPYPNNSFGIAFSNGVLHHTRDWQQGIRELVRVLEPGGFGWLYLIEKPGGLFWDSIEILRVVMRDEKHETARAALAALGIPGNRIFYMLDHVMVPINLRLTSEEIEECLAEAGAKDIRRLTRGADFDRVEQIYQGRPYAAAKYGVGENRHVFTK